MKPCIVCNRTPDEVPFRKVKGRNCSYCKECESDYKKQWYQEHKDGEKIKRKFHYGKDKETYIRRARRIYLLKAYGLTLDDYTRMFNEQDGRCAICGTHQVELDKALSVDHDHVTGKVRKLLCDRCNVSIGKFEDSPELLRKAAQYLEEML